MDLRYASWRVVKIWIYLAPPPLQCKVKHRLVLAGTLDLCLWNMLSQLNVSLRA